MRYKLLILFILFFAGQGLAQTDFSQFFEGDEQERPYKVAFWYSNNFDSPDSNIALPQLRLLLNEARDRDDKVVILFTEYLIAFYYVVNLKQDDPWLKETERIIDEAEKNKYEFLWADLLHRNGVIYYTVKREYARGLELQLRAHEKFLELGYSKNLRGGTVLYELAVIYYDLGNYEKCVELLKPAMSFKDTDTYIRLQVFNTIGLAYRNMNKPDSSLRYFYKTLELAKTKKDLAWVGIASINIGKYLISKGQYDKALPYVETRYKYSKIEDNRLSENDSCEALVVLAQIDIHKGNYDRAIEKLKMVEKSLKPGYFWNHWSRNFDLKRDMFSLLSDIYSHKNDFKKAYTFSTLAYRYEDSINIVRRQSQSQKIHTQVEAEKQLAHLKQVESETKLSIQSRNFSMIALSLGGLLLLSLYNRQRLKSKKDRELFQNREQLLHSEKQRAEAQLSGYMDTLHEKNKMIEEFHTEIERLKSLPYSSEKLQTIETLEKLQQTTIITEDDWLQFKELFEKVHHGFFVRVKGRYPDITQAEMRLMALTKLNISTKDMAGMLGISPDSIRKTGYRFLKKISPNGEADLDEIVASI